jgi:beta-glucanase (GH16 family)
LKRFLMYSVNSTSKLLHQTLRILAFQCIIVCGYAQTGTVTKDLLPLNSPELASLIEPEEAAAGQITTSNGPDGVLVNVKAGDFPFPGITVHPVGEKAWNLSAYGHIDAKVTNTSASPINFCLRVDNDAANGDRTWNTSGLKIPAGQSGTIRVYFGYNGTSRGYALLTDSVIRLKLFTGKAPQDFSYRIESIQASGPSDELPPGIKRIVKPKHPQLFPVVEGDHWKMDAVTVKTATGKVTPEDNTIQLTFPGSKPGSILVCPGDKEWNLNNYLQISLKVKNTGATPFKPTFRVESEVGATDEISTDHALAVGEEAKVTIPFAPSKPWVAVVDPGELDPSKPGRWGNQPGTGTTFRSNKTTGITVLSDKSAGDKALQITSIAASVVTATLPDWLGNKPPVDGDWVQTLDEEFSGDHIDLSRWNVHTANLWDHRMHFSRDQVIVKDGYLTLRMEKKPGYNNDDPTGKVKYSGAFTDYAAGQPDTLGKWTQRYGYFEIRERQPPQNSLWPGFWLMPDRGKDVKPMAKRGSTADGGMEFDITESQSSWGPYRFNVCCHFDNYKEAHKTVGTNSNYVAPDKDGFITVGFLWTPGSMIVYGNGMEIWRWESPRISSQESFMILQNEIGGWDNERVDDSTLPADYVVKYIRVWQRKDLATPEDGPKPNQGHEDTFMSPIPIDFKK